MTDHAEWRRNWRTNWLTSIQEFADDEAQRKLWLDKGNTNPHWSYVEYICCYFDGLLLSDGYEWAVEEAFLSAQEVEAVSDFHTAACDYSSPTNEYDHEAILSDPEWAKLVACAKRARENLLQLIDDPNERRVLIAS